MGGRPSTAHVPGCLRGGTEIPKARNRGTAPYGTWPSTITASLIGQAGDVWSRFDRPEPTADATFWLEARPSEGRTVLVRRGLTSAAEDVTPNGFDVRSGVHEYGGGAYLLDGPVVFFSNHADGRLYRQPHGARPTAITPASTAPGSERFADGVVVPGDEATIWVRERHTAQGVDNQLVAVRSDGSSAPRPLVVDQDFVSFPCVNSDATRLAWTSWRLPGMPFHGTDLWVAELRPDGSLGDPEHIAGGPNESIFQPRWSPTGELYFVTDRNGWWNLYRQRGRAIEAVVPLTAELGWPQWFCSLSSYDFLDDGRIACLTNWGSQQRLGLIDPKHAVLEEPDLPFTSVCYPHLRAHGTRVVFVAASPVEAPAVISWEATNGQYEILARSAEPVDISLISLPRPFTFRSRDGSQGRATHYPPTNPHVEAPEGEAPPLVVLAHGGPTDQAPQGLRLDIQFLTSRGIAVLDVDYAGSTGYGRAHADRLRGRWGEADVNDCVDAALQLAAQGGADRRRMAIAGGSAGGYVTLCALAFAEVFAAGVSLYGIADVDTFAAETHKFESGYVDWLVEPATSRSTLRRQRSPVFSANLIDAPLLMLQGLDDHVVPPSQSEEMAEALKRSGHHCLYIAVPGEGHGFRRAENLERAHATLLEFVLRAFGILPEGLSTAGSDGHISAAETVGP